MSSTPSRVVPLLLLIATGCGPANTDSAPADTNPDTTPVVSDEANRDGDCGFNADCPADQRCGCGEGLCTCEDGARGLGVNGVDTCATGDDCASALCVEGDAGVFSCSDACVTADDCGPALPVCLEVAFVGRICVRETPAR